MTTLYTIVCKVENLYYVFMQVSKLYKSVQVLARLDLLSPLALLQVVNLYLDMALKKNFDILTDCSAGEHINEFKSLTT
jgi:hypothetical protein